MFRSLGRKYVLVAFDAIKTMNKAVKNSIGNVSRGFLIYLKITLLKRMKIKIRPMMYLALSYDHRIIDGKESVGFLVKVKEMIENPSKIIFGGKDPDEVLLGL